MTYQEFRKLPQLAGLPRIKAKPPELRLRPRSDATTTDLPEEIQQLIPKMGERNARTVWKWKRRGLQAAAPEILVYEWLTGRKLRFEFQSSQFGGRRIRGGVVTDFIVWNGSRPMAWRVQGMHWHSGAATRAKDKANAIRIMASSHGGQRFIAVVDLWEEDVYRGVNKVCEEAMRGRGLRD